MINRILPPSRSPAFKAMQLRYQPPVIKKRLSDGTVQYEPDADLRDTENVPLKESIAAYFEREVSPFVPDAWIDHDKTRKGYEIPFTRHFYRFEAPRPLAEIDADLRRLSTEIQEMLREIAA